LFSATIYGEIKIVVVWIGAESALSAALRRNDPHPWDSQSTRLWQRQPAHCSQEPTRRRRVHVVAVSHGAWWLEVPAQAGAEMWVPVSFFTCA